MYTHDDLFTAMTALRLKTFPFLAMVTRNNQRHKELCFILKQYGPFQEHSTCSWSKTARIFIEVCASLDNETGKVSWNYADPGMQTLATEIIIDPVHRIRLHDRVIQIMGGVNKMKLAFLDTPAPHLQTQVGMEELKRLTQA